MTQRKRSPRRARKGGHDRERKLVNWLEDVSREPLPEWPLGWIAVRRPPRRSREEEDSGPSPSFDVMAAHAVMGLRLIEVKSTTAGPFSGFGPQARAGLVALAAQAGAEPWLCWWPFTRVDGPRFYPAPLWPATAS